jgi:hypothetical protein
VRGEFVGLTLVVAIKEDCWGCRSVLESARDVFGDVATLLVASRPSNEVGWRSTPHPLVVSPELLEQLDVRSPPFYVLIDPQRGIVLSEGVVFGPEQVREEIGAFVM